MVMNFYTRLEEVYRYCQKNNRVPYKNENILFSDGKKMGEWIDVYFSKIEGLSHKGNKKAEYILDYMTKARYMSFNERIREVCTYFDTHKKLPIKFSDVRFSDGVKMYYFLTSEIDKIRELAEKDSKAAVIYKECLKLKDLSASDKLNELHAYLLEKKSILYGKAFFSDGSSMYDYIESNFRKLEEEAKNGNIKAKFVVSQYIKYKVFTIDERIREIYDFYQVNGYIPNFGCDVRFKKGGRMCDWIKIHKNDIIFSANQGNYMAKEIYEFIIKKADIINTRISEIYYYILENNKIPPRDTNICFKDGVRMYEWFIKNKDIIEERALNNMQASYIVNFYNNKKENLMVSRLIELYDLKSEGYNLPDTKEKLFFSDGVNVYTWIITHKDDILEFANSENKKIREAVKMIRKKYYRMFIKTLTFEEKLKNAAEIIIANQASITALLKDGTSFVNFLNAYKDKIALLSDYGDKDAKIIVEFLKTRRGSLKDRIHQLKNYLDINKKFPDDSVVFSDNYPMKTWYIKPLNKIKIYKEATQGNKEALILFKYIKELDIETYNFLVDYSKKERDYKEKAISSAKNI